MKKISVFALASLAICLSLSVISCAKETPAGVYAEIFDNLADRIDNATSKEECAILLLSSQNECYARIDSLMAENATYVLTSDDKELLKSTLKRYMEVMLKKRAELGGPDPEFDDADAEEKLHTDIYPVIDAARTLGDLSQSDK